MGKPSTSVIQEIRKKFSDKFYITSEKEKPFPFCDTQYEPDIVLWSKDCTTVLAIIEVEQGTRKHMVGGVITADYCMKQAGHLPYFFVLALKPKYKNDYQKRLPMLRNYIKNIKEIVIGNKDEIITRIYHLYDHHD